MFETIWNDIKSKNDGILQSITEYNSKIDEGSYLEFNGTLDVVNYYNFLTAHIFNLLLDDKMLFVSKSSSRIRISRFCPPGSGALTISLRSNSSISSADLL